MSTAAEFRLLLAESIPSVHVLGDLDRVRAGFREDARRHGLPIWDLLDFLADAAMQIDQVPAAARAGLVGVVWRS